MSLLCIYCCWVYFIALPLSVNWDSWSPHKEVKFSLHLVIISSLCKQCQTIVLNLDQPFDMFAQRPRFFTHKCIFPGLSGHEVKTTHSVFIIVFHPHFEAQPSNISLIKLCAELPGAVPSSLDNYRLLGFVSHFTLFIVLSTACHSFTWGW